MTSVSCISVSSRLDVCLIFVSKLLFFKFSSSIKLLSPVLQLILILIALELVHIHAACEKNPSEHQQYLK